MCLHFDADKDEKSYREAFGMLKDIIYKQLKSLYKAYINIFILISDHFKSKIGLR